jgi:hypothetical protein
MQAKSLKLYVCLTLLVCTTAFSAEECLDKTSLSSFAKDLNTSCTRGKTEDEILDALPNDEELQSICSGCSLLVADNKGSFVPPTSAKLDIENQKAFAKSALNEIRKNLLHHLESLMTLRTSSVDFNPTEALSKCNVSEIGTHTCGGKKGPTINDILKDVLGEEDSIANIQGQIGNEIYNLANNAKEPALFNRASTNSCGITDSQFTYGKLKSWESDLTIEIISKFQEQLKTLKDNESLESQITSQTIGRSNVGKFKSALNHPLIAEIFRNKANLEKYLKKIKLTGDAQKDQGQISDIIYDKDFSASFAANISKSCETSFNKIKEVFCSEDFKKANVSFASPDTVEIATQDRPFHTEQKEKNLALYCHGYSKKDSKPLTLKSLKDITSAGVDSKYQNKHFEVLSNEHYLQKFHARKEDLCADLEKSPCTKDPISCKSIAFINNSKIPGSPEEKLFKKHNTNVDKILSAFVGTKPPVTNDAQAYLIAQGIIPGPNGEITQPTNDQKPQSPSSFAAAQKQFASENPKYTYNPPAKNGTAPIQPQGGQNNAPGFNPQSTTGNVSSKVGQNDQPDENPYPIANDELIDTKKNILNRLGKQFGPRPKVAKDISEISEPTKRKSLKTSGNRVTYPSGSVAPHSDPDFNNHIIPEEYKSQLTEAPKKKDEFNEAKQMMGNNRQPANENGGATGGGAGAPSLSSTTPTVSVAPNGDNVITLKTNDPSLEASELVKQLKAKINAEQLQVILESDKKIKVLVNGKEIILTPTSTGYLVDCKDESLKKYLEAITAFFMEQLKGVARVDDLNKFFR